MAKLLRILALVTVGCSSLQAGTKEAVMAIVPGMGHFYADRPYRGLAFTGSQVAFLFLGLRAIGNREAAALGTIRADEILRATDREEVALFNAARIERFNDDIDDYELQAVTFLGLFGVLYIGSLVDAYFLPTDSNEPFASSGIGLGVDARGNPQLSWTGSF